MSLTSEQRKLIDRFEVAFNKIHHHMRELIQNDTASFKNALNAVRYRKACFVLDRHYDELMQFTELRNVLVHRKVKVGSHITVPTEKSVRSIESIMNKSLYPETVGTICRRDVITVRTNTSLFDVIELIDEHEISQFPVYTTDGAFYDVLTENGIVMWLAIHLKPDLDIIDFSDHTVHIVDEALDEQEGQDRENHEFVSRHMPMPDAIYKFFEDPLLEVLLITEDGKKTQSLVGIMTRHDLQQLAQEHL